MTSMTAKVRQIDPAEMQDEERRSTCENMSNGFASYKAVQRWPKGSRRKFNQTSDNGTVGSDAVDYIDASKGSTFDMGV